MQEITDIREAPRELQRAYSEFTGLYPQLQIASMAYETGPHGDELFLTVGETQHALRMESGFVIRRVINDKDVDGFRL